MRRSLALAAAALALLPANARADEAFYLHDGDRVVFYGDSITEQRLYTSYVEDYVLTRYPGLNVSFVDSGWTSDTVSGGFGGPIGLRIMRDVFAHHPTVLTVMLGMNDGHRLAWNAPMATAYEAGYHHLLGMLDGYVRHARLTLLTPSPFDDFTRPVEYPGGYNPVLVKFGTFVRAQAQSRHVPLCDMNTPVAQMLEKAHGLDADLAKKLLPDRIHPGPAAHWVMADALLQTWQATPWVARVHVAVTGLTAQIDARGAQASQLDVKPGGVGWTELDAALPLFIDRSDPATALVLKASNVQADLSREPLVVSGLPGARYALAIDGREVGRFDRAELEAGLDLAVLPTPMLQQAVNVHALTVAHQGVKFARWRSLQVPLADWPSPAQSKALGALDALDAELVARQHAAAKPHPHRFQLNLLDPVSTPRP